MQIQNIIKTMKIKLLQKQWEKIGIKTGWIKWATDSFISLDKKWVRYLMEQPEFGMGYQKVNVLFQDETHINNAIVRNCSKIQLSTNDRNKKIKSLTIGNNYVYKRKIYIN